MSIQGDIAVKVELERLLTFIESNENKSLEAQLRLLKAKINETIKAADSGWL